MGEQDEQTLAVVVARLGDLREECGKLRVELSERDKQYVTRTEFELVREANAQQVAQDRRARESQAAEATRRADELQKQLDARHVSWTAVVAAVVAVAALAWSIVQTVAA